MLYGKSETRFLSYTKSNSYFPAQHLTLSLLFPDDDTMNYKSTVSSGW